MATEENDGNVKTQSASASNQPAKQDDFVLTFKTMTGDVHELQCQSNDTIGCCREQLASIMEVPSACLIIVKGSKKLTDPDKTLADCNIDSACLLKLVVRLMNVISLESLQGEICLVSPDGGGETVWNISYASLEGNKFHLHEYPDMIWDVVIGKDKFGFKFASKFDTMEQNFAPAGIMPGLIKITMLDEFDKPRDEGEVGYFVKNINFPPQIIAEIQKTWPDFTYEPKDNN